MNVDLLVTNAHILTQDPAHPVATSLVVHGGRILAVDPDPGSVSAAQTLDAGGRTITPGFNDVHAHSVWFGLGLMEADLVSAADLPAVYAAISAAATDLGPDEWVIASGFSPLLVGAQPDPDALDIASGSRPVWIKHASGHAYGVSRRALQLAVEHGADLDAAIDGGVIGRDRDGVPNGLLEERAMSIIQDFLLPYPLATIERALDLATAHYLTEGITSVTDAGIAGGWIGHSPREFAAYLSARDHGVLRTRMQPMVAIDALHALPGHRDDPDGVGLDAGIRTGLGDEWLSLGPTKIFTDGSLLGSTAFMSEDYVGCPHNHGYLQMDADQLRERALGAARAGWSVAMHAIGDRAVDHAIDILSEAQRSYGVPRVPHRIEHGGVVRPDQIPKLAAANIVLVPQPHFVTQFGDGMAELLGPERTAWSYPARSLVTAGLPLPGSSDRPVSEGRPLDVIAAFVQRTTPSGAVYGPEERLSAAEALYAYTHGSAIATGFGEVKGRLMPGYLADLVVLSADPTAVAADEIAAIEVLATMVGGTLAFNTLPARSTSEKATA